MRRALVVFGVLILLGCLWETFVAPTPRPVCEVCVFDPASLSSGETATATTAPAAVPAE